MVDSAHQPEAQNLLEVVGSFGDEFEEIGIALGDLLVSSYRFSRYSSQEDLQKRLRILKGQREIAALLGCATTVDEAGFVCITSVNADEAILLDPHGIRGDMQKITLMLEGFNWCSSPLADSCKRIVERLHEISHAVTKAIQEMQGEE